MGQSCGTIASAVTALLRGSSPPREREDGELGLQAEDHGQAGAPCADAGNHRPERPFAGFARSSPATAIYLV